MESQKTNIFCKFLSENMDVLLALAVLILITFFLIGRFMLAEGTILFGDFVPTLELRQFLRVHYPMWSNRNSFNYVGSMRLPYLLIFYFPFYIVNAPAEVFFKFVIMSVFVISGFSMYVTARHFLNKLNADRKTVFLCCIISSLFYAFNPWVMDRIYHYFLLVTYSFLPLILLISIQIFDKDRVDLKRVLALVLLCSIASTSPHSVFFILSLIVSLYGYFLLLNRKQFVPKTKNLVFFIALYVLVNAFWILPLADYSLSTGLLYPDYILHLDDVNTLSRNSNFFNVFRLVAYWWPKVSHSFEAYPLNVLWVFASLTVPAVCFPLIFYRKNRVAIYLSLLSVVLILLASGMSSPLPSFYEWLCFDAPVLSAFGWLFRDPNKWTLLLPLTYSILLAFACLGVMGLISRCELPPPKGSGFLLHRANPQSGSQPFRCYDGNAPTSTFSFADAREYTGVSKEGSDHPSPTLAKKKYKIFGFHPNRKRWGLPADRVKKAFFRKATVLAFTLLFFSLVFVYITPSATNYFEGPFKPLKIPSEIYSVNSWLGNDSASYNVLWLPSYAEYGATWVYNGLSGAFELDSSAKPTFDINSKYSRIYLNYFDMALTKNKSDYAADYLNPLNIRYIIFHNDSKSESINYTKSLFQSLTSQKDLELIKHDGDIYVFENNGAKWCESAFKVNEKVIGVIGGFDKFIALNALKPFNLSDYSMIFLDQNLPYANVNFDAFILSGDLLNDALSFFVNETAIFLFLLAPFDFCRRHDPANCWSKGSLSDLLGGLFHPNLENFKIECWDFDYDKGVVFTWASSARLDMQFSLSSGGNFDLSFRIFENELGGKVKVYVDGLPIETIDTQSQTNKFWWRKIGVLNLTSGWHVLTLENVNGLNAVNLAALTPLEKTAELKGKFEAMLQEKDLLYVLEAETDMQRENASVGNYSGASNGRFVFLARNSAVSKSLELLYSGNYTFTIKGMGNLLLTVDNKSYIISLPQFGWKNFTAHLSSGPHQIRVSSFSIIGTGFVDVLWIWKQNENSSQGNASARVLSVKEIGTTRFVVELEVDEPSMLCFFKAYDPAWYVSFDGKVVGSTRVFGVANGFWIDAKGRIVVTIEFQPQKWFYIGLAISLLTLLVCSTGLLYTWWRKRRSTFLMTVNTHCLE